MKQKTRFKNFGNIGYRSMNGQYTVSAQKKHIGRSLNRIIYIMTMA